MKDLAGFGCASSMGIPVKLIAATGHHVMGTYLSSDGDMVRHLSVWDGSWGECYMLVISRLYFFIVLFDRTEPSSDTLYLSSS